VEVRNRRFVLSLARNDASGSVDLDSHADTFVGGSNCVLVASTGESATVHSFSNERKPFGKIPIGTVAMAWVNPSTGETFVLIFHEALFFGNCLDHSLLCPNQLRAHGVKVYDTPKSFEPGSPHAIMLDDPELKEITIPLRLRGVFSCFDTHQPTEEEMENCRRIVLTSEEPWNPNDATFARPLLLTD